MVITSFVDVQNWINNYQPQLDALRTQNLDMAKRRVINASPSVDSGDYVTKGEISSLIAGSGGTVKNTVGSQNPTTGSSSPDPTIAHLNQRQIFTSLQQFAGNIFNKGTLFSTEVAILFGNSTPSNPGAFTINAPTSPPSFRIRDNSQAQVLTLGVAVTGDNTLEGKWLPNTSSVYDLGSNTKLWKDLWLSGTMHGNWIPSADLIPASDASFNLGAVGTRWLNLYLAGDVNCNNVNASGNVNGVGATFTGALVAASVSAVSGINATVTLAKITTGGTNGSITFTGGVATSYLNPS